MRRFLWIFGTFLGALVVGGWALGLPAVERAAVAWVQARVRAAGGTLEVKALDFDPWRVRLRVEGLHAAGDAWAVDLDEGEVRLHPGRWLLGRPRVSARLVGPRVAVRTTRSGPPGGGARAAGRRTPPLVSVETLEIADGSLRWEDPAAGMRLEVDGADATWREDRGEARIGGTFSWAGEAARFEGRFRGARRLGALRVEELALGFPGGAFTIDGTWASGDRLDLGVRLEARPGEIPEAWLRAAGLGRFLPWDGVLELAGRVTGSVRAPRAEGELALRDGRFGAVERLAARGRWEARPGGVGLADLSIASSVGGVEGLSARLVRAGGGLELQAQGTARGFDLRPFMGLFSSRWFPVGLRASGAFRAKGPLAPLGLGFGVDCVVEDLDVTVHPGETPVYGLGRARVVAEGTVGTEDLRIASGRIEAGTARIGLGNGRIAYREGMWLETDLAFSDLAVAGRWAPPDLGAAGRARGRVEGPFRDLTFVYDVDARAAYRGQDLGRVGARVRLDYGGLRIEGGAWDAGWGRAEMRGALGWKPGRGLDLGLELRSLDLAAAASVAGRLGFGLPVALGGAAEGEVRVEGTLARPMAQGHLSARGVSVAGYGAERVSAAFRAERGAWRVSRLEAQGYGARATGEAEGDREKMRGRARFQGLALGALLADAGVAVPAWAGLGRARGTLEAVGPYRGLDLHLEATVDGLDLAGVRPGPVAVTGSWRGRGIRATARGFGDALRAALAADLGAGFELAWRLEAWDPAWLGDRVPEGIRLGPVSGEGSLTGDFGTPAGSWAFTWSGGTTALEAFGRALGPVALTLDGGGGGVRFGARAPDLGAEATGLQSWEGGWPLEAEVRAPALPLGRVVPGIEAGTASVEIRASAGVRAWLEGKTWPERLAGLGDLDGRLSWTGVRWNGREVPGGAAEVRTGPEGRAVEVRARGLDAKARLRDETSLAWEARAEAEGLDLSPWLPAGWSGRLSGRGEARGRGAAVERGEWRGRAEAVAGPWFGPLDAPLDLRWEGGRIVGRTGLGPELAVEGEWSPAGGARGRAVLRAFRPGRWMARERWPEDLDVSLDGELRAEAPAGAPVRAEMDLGGVAVDLPPLRLRNRGPVRIRWEGGALRLDQVWIEGGDVTLTASGLAGPGPGWDLRGKARCDLSMLARWIGPVESARGTLFADLEVTGPWSDPRFRGPIQVYPGAEARIRGVGLALSEAEASATLDPQDGLILEWFDAALGAGRIHVEGRMPLAGLVPTDVRLWVEVRDVDHEEPPGVRYAGDADLLVTGLPPGMRVVGEVRLERFRFTRRISWKTMLLDLLQRRPRKVESAAETSGVTLDIAVRGDRDLRVENNLAEVDLAADLRVRGPATRPVLWGRLEVLAGEVQFRNTVYEMRRSSVEFLGDAGPLPLLDVHARAQVSGYRVNVDITGPLDDYQVLLSSSPPLEYTDIVSLLTLGATSENLAGGQGVSAAEAASFLTGKVQDTLESGVGELLGFDQFHIDPAYSPAAQSTVPRVTIGKAITRDLYARYAATVGAEAAQDLEVQYRLSPHVSLLGTWSDRGAESSGSLGGEVRFRFTFR